ncbi:hypothetical protein AB0M43_22325 [Longispora sp. NPDC051575]|uniref:hypothetical protein n=1 Tax=Longispora sp. NPDC051575 TaxID=3154943 RepID=UPI0034265141
MDEAVETVALGQGSWRAEFCRRCGGCHVARRTGHATRPRASRGTLVLRATLLLTVGVVVAALALSVAGRL